jgi:glycosyltransferase involved in cell wall biosynthesis
LKLLVAIPTHNELLSTSTVATLLGLQAAMADRGDRVEFRYYSSAIIAELRNKMLYDLMAGDADGVLMLDSDQGCAPDLILRLIDSGHWVCGCLYPHRRYDFARVPAGLDSGDIARVLEYATTYVGRLRPESDGSFKLNDGFVAADYLGTGVMLIRREAVVLMQGRFPELKGRGMAYRADDTPVEEIWGLFNPLIIGDLGGPVQEDYAFCHRWRVVCDQPLWADVITPVAHVGRTLHQGVFMQHVRATEQPAPEAGAPAGGALARKRKPRAAAKPTKIAEAPTPDGLLAQARDHLQHERTSLAWSLASAIAALRPEDLEAAAVAADAAEARGDWASAVGLRDRLATADPDSPGALLALQRATLRCGGLKEARDLARFAAGRLKGPGRLWLICEIAEAYGAISKLRPRAERLARWLSRAGATAPPPALDRRLVGLELRLDMLRRADAGDLAGAIDSGRRWLARSESWVVEATLMDLLMRVGRPQEVLAIAKARLGDGRADWKTMIMAAWAAGEVGRLVEIWPVLAAATVGIGNETDLGSAYRFIRACAAYGEGRRAAGIVADGLDPLIAPGWLAAYLDEDVVPAAVAAAAERLHGAVAPAEFPAPATPSGVHIVSQFLEPVGGAEMHGVELAQALSDRVSADCWSIDTTHPLWRDRGVRQIERDLGPRGGLLVIVGAWYSLGPWLARAQPDRVAIIFNTFSAPQLEAMVLDIVRQTGVRPELRFVSPLMQQELGLPGLVRPSLTNITPYLKAPPGPPRAVFTVGRLSRDSVEKHRLSDVAVYRALLDQGDKVRLIGAGVMAAALGPHPRLDILPAVPGAAPEFLRTLDVFYYRTGLWVEPCARVVFEAMASGLPVVIDATDGAGAFLENGVDGFLVSSAEEGLARLQQLKADPGLRAKMGQAARASAVRLMMGAGLEATLEVFAPAARMN